MDYIVIVTKGSQWAVYKRAYHEYQTQEHFRHYCDAPDESTAREIAERMNTKPY